MGVAGGRGWSGSGVLTVQHWEPGPERASCSCPFLFAAQCAPYWSDSEPQNNSVKKSSLKTLPAS